jgi:hypothetical protein
MLIKEILSKDQAVKINAPNRESNRTVTDFAASPSIKS